MRRLRLRLRLARKKLGDPMATMKADQTDRLLIEGREEVVLRE